ncbi:class I SAM-dependent methyltransferase [Patescibacteria group bacterium]|nr:class I SAM-dependent methyltransferase [Patescibacteria group bacterium]
MKKFPQDKTNGFFSFFTGVCESEGSPMKKEEVEGNFFTNKKFRKACLDSQIFSLRQILQRYSGNIMVDIGCGTGEYALYLKGLYHAYYGLEPFHIPAEVAVPQSVLPENAFLVQYDSTRNLPLHADTADVISFIASYDHAVNTKNLLQDAYGKLKDGGYLIIMCTNYNFWAKQLINKLAGKKMFQHKETHFNVYSPDSLINEIQSFIPVKAVYMDAGFFFLPNLPKAAGFLYFSAQCMVFANSLLRNFFSLVSMKDAGSGMVVVFKK